MVQYSQPGQLDQEAPHEDTENKPPVDWPAHGAIEFKDIVMSYRPGLPKVLNKISVNIKGGEKIGVVGRYVHFSPIWLYLTATHGAELEPENRPSCLPCSGSWS